MNVPGIAVSLLALSLSLSAATQAYAASGAADDAAASASDADAGPSIVVTGRNETPTLGRPVAAGILGNKSALDTPFTVSAVTTDEIQNLQTKDIVGAFRDDASITAVNSSLAAASGSAFRVRGVALDQLNSVKIDGLAIPWWSIDLPIDQFDQVQLLKGATGFMYGFGSPAGVLNYVSRRAGDGLTFNLDAGFRSDSLYGGHIDVGDRSTDGKFGIRVNLQGETGTIYNGGRNNNVSATIAVDYKLTDNLTWSADGFFMNTRQEDEVNTVSVTNAVTHLAPVSGDTNFGAKGDWKTNQMGVATTGLSWDFAPNWSAKVNYRWSRLDENFPGNLITITDNAGDFVNSAFFVRRLFKYNQVQGLVQGTADTGPFKHELIFGAEYEDQGQFSDVNSLTVHPLGTGNIYQPLNISLANYPSSNYNPILYELNHYLQRSLFAADTISIGKWSLLVGVRYTDYKDTADGPNQAIVAVYKAHPVSPTVALTYSLDDKTRVYFSYVQGLQNGGAAGATNVNNGETFGPIHTTQYELGLKTEHSIWHAALALFKTEQDAAYVTTDNYYVQSGTGRYQGVEVSGAVKPTQEFTLSGSASYLDTTFLDEGPIYSGKEIPGVPKFQAAGDIAYQPNYLPGLRLDANVKYTGSGYDNTVNTLKMPAYTTVDLNASYGFDVGGHHIVARFGVKNVGNKNYWIYSSSTVIPGEPRTFVAGLHFGF